VNGEVYKMIKYVYGDVLFLENVAMNYMILFSTAKLVRSNYNKLKLLAASALGALYSVFYYLPGYEYLYTWFLKILFSLFIVIVAFTPYKLKELIRLVSMFYIITFVFGGAAFGLYYIISGIKHTYKDIFFFQNFPIKLLLLSVTISYFIVRYSWDYTIHRLRREKIISKANICLNGKKILVSALVDTGNSLNDPVSKLPVVVVEYSSVKDIIPHELKKIFEENKENNINLIATVLSQSEWLTRFRLIPFKSLGTDNALMIGFKPDEFNIEHNNENQIVKELIIGIYNRRLSGDGEYNALIHPDILSFHSGGNNSA